MSSLGQNFRSLENRYGSCINYSSRFSENVELRQYYYGEKVPIVETVKRKKSNRNKFGGEMDVHVKCTACPKLFKKSSDIIPHIFEHIEADEAGSFVIRERLHPLRHSNLLCNICMKKTSMDSLSAHVKHSHDMKNHQFSCRICELYYDSKKELVSHMHYTHPCLDMPYSCEVCRYQASFRTSLFKHFEENHQKNFVMCNFCMRAMPVESLVDMKSLESHLMQHVLHGNIKCSHCTLKFICQDDLTAHLSTKHQRHSDTTKIEELKLYKLCKGEDPLLMFIPFDKNPRRTQDPSTRAGPPSKRMLNTNSTESKTDDSDSDDDISIVYESHPDGINGNGALSHEEKPSTSIPWNRESSKNDCDPSERPNFKCETRTAEFPPVVPPDFLIALGLQRARTS